MKYDSAFNNGIIYDYINNGFTADLPFYLDITGKEPRKILELGCGTGRVSIPLIKAGHKLTCIDISPFMLEALNAKLKLENICAQDIILGDLSEIRIDETFDFVLIPYKAFQHIHDFEKICQTLLNSLHHLKKGGKLVIDVFNPNLNILMTGSSDWAKAFQYLGKDGEKVQIFQKHNYDQSSQIDHIHWQHRALNGNILKEDQLHMRMFFPQEIHAILRLSGFLIESHLGDYNQTPFQSSSQNQILICQKP